MIIFLLSEKKYVNRGGCIKEIVKVREYEKQEIRDTYRSLIEVEWFNVKDARLLNVEDEWEKCKSIVLRSAGELCGYKRIGRRGKKSEWWNDEMRELVKDKRTLCELFLENEEF